MVFATIDNPALP